MIHDVKIKHPFDKRKRAILRIYPVRLDLKNTVLTGLIELLSIEDEVIFAKHEVRLDDLEFEDFMSNTTTIDTYTRKVLDKLNLCLADSEG